MRVAFVGKGGAGKSTVAGTLARLVAADGERVLAVDSDPMPGLAFALGLERVDTGVPDAAVEEHSVDGRTGYRLRPGLTAEQAILQYAAQGADGVRLLQLGKARGVPGENLRAHHAFQQILDELPRTGWTVVGDLPGGTRQPFFGWGRYADTVVVVVEPTPASMLSARRLARLAGTGSAPRGVAVVNKSGAPGDADLVAERTGLTVLADVPLDPAVSRADRRGTALLDHDAGAPAVDAVRHLRSRLLEEEARR
ncbi:MAG: AAA family ATPase [Actinomycetota bacterium]|nr:AAA family ATPase [Actinomycetota bacterium]